MKKLMLLLFSMCFGNIFANETITRSGMRTGIGPAYLSRPANLDLEKSTGGVFSDDQFDPMHVVGSVPQSESPIAMSMKEPKTSFDVKPNPNTKSRQPIYVWVE